MFDRAHLPSPGEATRTEPLGSVGLCFPGASEHRHIRNPWNDPPSPPTVGPGELHKGRGGGGAGFSSQEHSIPAAQTSRDPSQGQRPKGTSAYPKSPHPFQGRSQWSPAPVPSLHNGPS